jgi:hypothetical protein
MVPGELAWAGFPWPAISPWSSPWPPLTKEHAPLGCSSSCLLCFVGGGVARARVGGERPVRGQWDAV